MKHLVLIFGFMRLIKVCHGLNFKSRAQGLTFSNLQTCIPCWDHFETKIKAGRSYGT